MDPSAKRIAVFFTHGVSLELWEKRGMFSREVKFYEELAKLVGEAWFFTYGREDAQFASRLDPRIRIFPKRLHVPNLVYGLLLPFLYWRKLSLVHVIRIHQMAGAIPALITRWLLRKPLTVRCGYQWSKFLERTGASKTKQWAVSVIEMIAYNTAASVIVTSQEDLEYVAQRYGIDRPKLHLIPNYVDTDLFKPMAVEKEPRTICFVGRLEEQKNVRVLIEAMQDVDGTLVIYGDGSLKNELKELARALHVDAQFHDRIANDELPATLNACEVFVLPSLYEGNPKVLLEAMACGLPVVGTNVEGIVSLIQDGRTGILCEPTSHSIRQAIVRLLDDVDLRSRLGAAAHESILSSCLLHEAVQKETSLYQA